MFMQPQVKFGLWLAVDTNEGTNFIPAEYGLSGLEKGVEVSLDSLLEKYAQYPEGWTSTEFETAETAAENEWGEITSSLRDYVSGSTIESITLREAWGARFSAPGYMDATEWSLFDTEEEAKASLMEEMDDEELIEVGWADKWEVIVGNIGTAYAGVDEEEARKHFAEYVEQSKSMVGRAGGENVHLVKNDEPVEDFFGKLNEEDSEPVWATYYFRLSPSPQGEETIASTEARSIEEARQTLAPLYEGYELIHLPNYQE